MEFKDLNKEYGEMILDNKQVTVITCDGIEFKIQRKIGCISNTIRNLFEDINLDEEVFLPQITGKVLTKILEYLNKEYYLKKSKKREFPSNNENREQKYEYLIYNKYKEKQELYEDDFCNSCNIDFLMDVLMAANYLEIEKLIDSICRHIGEKIRCKDQIQLREIFGITEKDNFTEEEKLSLKNTFKWLENK